MRKKGRILLTLFFCCLCIASAHGQTSVPAAGGNGVGAGGTASYTIGQIVYTTNTGSNGTVAEGVQQPWEISVITGFKEASGINLIYSAYPNPVSDFLILKVENYDNDNLSYKLYDINGKPIEEQKVTGNETYISMRDLFPSLYFLKVIDNQREIKTFKIIKTK